MSDRGRFKKNLKRKALETHDIIAFSYHEASHSCFGLLKFMKINEVSVFYNKKNQIEGGTEYETPTDELFEKTPDLPKLVDFWVKSEIGMAYSGFCAEKLYFNKISGSEILPLFLKDGSSDDIAEAAAFIKKYNLAAPGQKRYVFKQKMIKQTSKLLEEYWNDIVLISHALFDRKKLNYEDLKDLLTKKSENKIFWKTRFKEIDFIFEHDLDEEQMSAILLAN